MDVQTGFEYDGPPEWAGLVRAALEEVVDPEMALDIVNLGLVCGVRGMPGRVEVRLTMTSAACPVSELIVDEARDALVAALGSDVHVDVQLVWDPPWTPERMSERARRAMGWS